MKKMLAISLLFFFMVAGFYSYAQITKFYCMKYPECPNGAYCSGDYATRVSTCIIQCWKIVPYVPYDVENAKRSGSADCGGWSQDLTELLPWILLIPFAI